MSKGVDHQPENVEAVTTTTKSGPEIVLGEKNSSEETTASPTQNYLILYYLIKDEPLEKGSSFESSQENRQLPPHSAQPRDPSPRDDDHVQPPSTSGKSPKIKKPKIFPCKTCLRPFTNRTSADRHAHTHLNSSELEKASFYHSKCPHCKKVFFRRKDLTDHLFVHMSADERAEVRQGWRHKCYFCTKRFKSPSHLSRHLVTHTKEKLGGRCHTCRKTCSSKDSLIRHLFSHLRDEEKAALVKQGTSRVCLFCQKIFPSNGTYHAHLVSHTMEKPFRCDQCGAQFANNNILTRHARIHSADPRPFKCTECDQAFGRKEHLARHKKTVHGGLKDIACPQCGKKFGDKSDMIRHVKGVHGKIRHPCPHCGEIFTQKGNLGRHMRKVHPPE
ncbi:zinc finger protein OZF-like [Folsomia candida]|uniref:zinc finger protein OZF-like n=1 Tax=Folsomia candida TaxID=158441 RepID=UPI000B9040B1|nr:zinc finger protein OZF-like [Folsomia candida]